MNVATEVQRCDTTDKVCMGRVIARDTAKKMRRGKSRGGSSRRITHYHCSSCGWWHVGNSLTPKRRRRW